MDIIFSDAAPADIPVLLATTSIDNAQELLASYYPNCDDQIHQSLSSAKFQATCGQCVNLLSPRAINVPQLIVAGYGEGSNDEVRFQRGIASAIASAQGSELAILAPKDDSTGRLAALAAQAAQLACYRFDKYKSKSSSPSEDHADDDDLSADCPNRVTVISPAHAAAKETFPALSAVANGVNLARDFVCEPGNILHPTEFVSRIGDLTKLGLEVEVLSDAKLRGLGAQALLSVAAGSEYPGYLVTIRWRGSNAPDAPTYGIVGKGVTFDSGGISIKPAGKMDEMKGDMAGAAAAVGLMSALAQRRAQVDVVCCVGIVENVLSDRSMRPGDVVRSMSSKTIEIANTDAEGRLVLADVLTYIQRNYSPVAIVDMATLTGACLVALGRERAGMFSNNDELSTELSSAGDATGELVWPMPMDNNYDKLISSKVADVRNIGKDGYGGAITAAKFLQRFVEGSTKWAHLDIAGVAFAHSPSKLDPAWASGFGVRLLNQWLQSKEQL